MSDTSELEQIARDVLAANAGPVADFKAGKEKAFGFLVGQMMKATKGKGNPKIVNDVLRDALTKV